MTEIEKTGRERLDEVVLPKIETSIRELKPVEFGADDVIILSQAFLEAGVNYNLTTEDRRSLLEGKQFRARVKLDDQKTPVGVEIFDHSLPEGERWRNIDEYSEFVPDMFVDKNSGVMDKSHGVLALLGKEGYKKLVVACFLECERSGFKKTIDGKKVNKGRGLQQAASDLLVISTLDPANVDFNQNLKVIQDRFNKRLWQSFRSTTTDLELKSKINTNFRTENMTAPTNDILGYPPDALPEIIKLLAS